MLSISKVVKNKHLNITLGVTQNEFFVKRENKTNEATLALLTVLQKWETLGTRVFRSLKIKNIRLYCPVKYLMHT